MTDIADKRVLTKERTELHFYDEVYRVYVVYLITSRDYFKQFLVDAGLKQSVLDTLDLETSSGYCINLNADSSETKGQNCFIIWNYDRQVPLLVHELNHLTLMIFDEKDIPIRAENQEAICYYLEHWVKRVTEAWVLPKVKRKKETVPVS